MVTITNNINEAFIFGIFIITHLIYLFFANCAGQEITDHGIKFFKATCVSYFITFLKSYVYKFIYFDIVKNTINFTLIIK